MQENTASTEVFKARNGLHVRQAENGGVEVGKPGYLDYTTPAATFALEEFFQAKRDAELRRWRWPENPEYVVYPFETGDGCTSLSERTGVSTTYLTRSDVEFSGSYLAPAARAYFEAHPERKPWRSAEAGEVWILSIDESEDIPCIVTPSGPDFEPIAHPVWATFARGSDRITAARRIWPEDAS